MPKIQITEVVARTIRRVSRSRTDKLVSEIENLSADAQVQLNWLLRQLEDDAADAQRLKTRDIMHVLARGKVP